MAKLSLATIGSRYASVAALNANFDAIEQALENTLSRDGTSPNQLEADLDMNGHTLLNLGALQVGGVNISGLNSALVWRGVWDSGTTYVRSDGVYYNGSSYICTSPNTNDPPPSSNWDLLAAQGPAGAGNGDVLGPASSTNNAVVLYDGPTGTQLKDGVAPGTSGNVLVSDGTSWTSSTLSASSLASSAVTTAKIADSNVTTAKIADSNVTYAKVQNVSAASRLLGRGSAGGAGVTEEISIGTGLSMSGTTLSSTVTSGQLQYALYSANDTWVCPAGVTKVMVVCIGGGGGGANDGMNYAVTGGAGGVATGIYTVTPGNSYTVTVGSGGAGGTASGSSGGASSFSSICSATGGGGGNSTVGTYGAPGSGTAGVFSSGNASTGVAPFAGTAYQNTSVAAVAWTTARLPGAYGSPGFGGVGGVVLIQYVG